MLTLLGSGLTGLGLGATVAPALLVAGFSLPSASRQRGFAIVELLRAVAAFLWPRSSLTSPNHWRQPQRRYRHRTVNRLGLAVGGGVIGAAICALSGAAANA